MCIQCGCGTDAVGSAAGMMSVEMEESSMHEMAEGMVDPD